MWNDPGMGYFEQKQVDVREAHVFATAVMNSADGWRREMWTGERKRLATIYAECVDAIKGRPRPRAGQAAR